MNNSYNGSLVRAKIETVPFHGDTLEGARDGERAWVSIRRVCEALGIDHSAQMAKLYGKPWAVVGQFPMTGPDGKTYEMACIDLDGLPMWLATIDVKRVAEHVRGKLALYQKEAAAVLRDHFFGKRAPVAPPVANVSPEWTPEGMLLRRAELARYAADVIGPFVSPEVRAVIAAHGAAPLLGMPVETMLPALPSGEWLRPTQIAERCGVSANAVGRAISALGLRGDPEHCKTIMDEKRGSAGQVPCYLYDAHAVERIRAHVTAKAAA